MSAAPETITGCSQQDVELAVTKVCQTNNELFCEEITSLQI